jgi:hypothetical protein
VTVDVPVAVFRTWANPSATPPATNVWYTTINSVPQFRVMRNGGTSFASGTVQLSDPLPRTLA